MVKPIVIDEQVTPDGTAFVDLGAGEPLVLIHGVGLNKLVWAPQWEAFSERYRVIAYDTLGHGKSRVHGGRIHGGRIHGGHIPGDQVTLDDYFSQLIELIDSLGLQRINLCGHSMGALITIGFTLKHPQRVNSIIPMMAAFDRDEAHRLRSLGVADILAGPHKDSLLNATMQRWFTAEDYADEQRREKISQVRQWLSEADQVGYSNAYRMFAQNGETYVGHLDAISVPALFITGEFDPNSTPAMSQKMASQVQHGIAYIMSNERHMGQYVAAHSIETVITEFLNKNTSAEA